MKILFTGGGSGGHFYPIIAISKEINEIAKKEKALPPEIFFMAPEPYDERALFDNGIKYLSTPAGKIRRYFSFKNFTDAFKTLAGIVRAIFTVFTIYPDIIFGKGGHGSFPALVAGRLFGIPVMIHESDTKPGRVNKWAGKFATRIAISYPEAADYFPKGKVTLTGQPIRKELAMPIKEGAFDYLKLEEDVPTILILGGSQGAQKINEVILDSLVALVEKYQIIHQTGTENYKSVQMTSSVILEKSEHKSRYHPYPYLNELSLRMSAGVSKLVLSRAGSTLFEISSWGIPCIVIPIPEDISHDQLGNAFAYAHTGAGIVIEEKNLTQHLLQFEIDRLINDLPLYEKMSDAAKKIDSVNSAEKIAREIFKIALSHEK